MSTMHPREGQAPEGWKMFVSDVRLPPVRPAVTPDQDPGDEDDYERRKWRVVIGKTLCFWPRSWSEEKVHTLPDHDGGDEDPWQPLSELSQMRLARRLGFA